MEERSTYLGGGPATCEDRNELSLDCGRAPGDVAGGRGRGGGVPAPPHFTLTHYRTAHLRATELHREEKMGSGGCGSRRVSTMEEGCRARVVVSIGGVGAGLGSGGPCIGESGKSSGRGAGQSRRRQGRREPWRSEAGRGADAGQPARSIRASSEGERAGQRRSARSRLLLARSEERRVGKECRN